MNAQSSCWQVVGPPVAGVQEIEIEDALGLLGPSNEDVVMLNATASDIWRLSDGEHTLDQIVHLLAGAYGISDREVRSDVLSTLQMFLDCGLLDGKDTTQQVVSLEDAPSQP